MRFSRSIYIYLAVWIDWFSPFYSQYSAGCFSSSVFDISKVDWLCKLGQFLFFICFVFWGFVICFCCCCSLIGYWCCWQSVSVLTFANSNKQFFRRERKRKQVLSYSKSWLIQMIVTTWSFFFTSSRSIGGRKKKKIAHKFYRIAKVDLYKW